MFIAKKTFQFIFSRKQKIMEILQFFLLQRRILDMYVLFFCSLSENSLMYYFWSLSSYVFFIFIFIFVIFSFLKT
jgi:hypothetical protein